MPDLQKPVTPSTQPCPNCRQPIVMVPSATGLIQCPMCRRVFAITGGGQPTAQPIDVTYGRQTEQARLSYIAVGSLALGAVSWFFLFLFPLGGVLALLAVLLGFVAMLDISDKTARRRGKWVAILGISSGGLCLLSHAVNLAPTNTVVPQAQASPEELCYAKLSMIAQTLIVYDSTHSTFPDELDALLLSPTTLKCPTQAGLGISYYYVPGRQIHEDPNTIIAYENPDNHDGEGGHIVHLDGTVQFVPNPEFNQKINAIKLADDKPFAPHKVGR